MIGVLSALMRAHAGFPGRPRRVLIGVMTHAQSGFSGRPRRVLTCVLMRGRSYRVGRFFSARVS